MDTLNSASNITVFAPDNAAFAKIPAATLAKVLADKAELTKILTYHVAAARYTPDQLAAGTTIKTLEGASVTPGKMGATYEVNDAHVVCGNVQTANATVYIIDTVLMPPPPDNRTVLSQGVTRGPFGTEIFIPNGPRLVVTTAPRSGRGSRGWGPASTAPGCPPGLGQPVPPAGRRSAHTRAASRCRGCGS